MRPAVAASASDKHFDANGLASGFLKSSGMSEWWLLDSGASRSVLSTKFVKDLPSRERPLPEPLGFTTASGEPVDIDREAYVGVTLGLDRHGKIARQKCSLRCMIANVEHNLLSITQLVRMGLNFSTNSRETLLEFKVLIDRPVAWSGAPSESREQEVQHADRAVREVQRRVQTQAIEVGVQTVHQLANII